MLLWRTLSKFDEASVVSYRNADQRKLPVLVQMAAKVSKNIGDVNGEVHFDSAGMYSVDVLARILHSEFGHDLKGVPDEWLLGPPERILNDVLGLLVVKNLHWHVRK